MRGIDVSEDLVKDIMKSKVWADQGIKLNLKESQEVQADGEEDAEDLDEAEEVHVCPLCESHLDGPLDQDVLDEHVSYIVDVLESAFNDQTDELDVDDEDSEDQ